MAKRRLTWTGRIIQKGETTRAPDSQARGDRRSEVAVGGAVAGPQATVGERDLIAQQAERPGVDVQHFALVVEQGRRRADQFEAVGDAAGPGAGK